MHRVHNKLTSLIPLLILALILVGCARSRPEAENVNIPLPAQNGESPVAETVPSEQDGAPTTIAIQPTATPTAIAADSETGAAEAAATNTPIGESATPTPATPTPTAVTSLPSPQQGVSGQAIIHIVQPGENLFRIGLKYQVDADTLAKFNGIVNPDKIFAGQRIKIPGGTSGGPGNIYVVRPGDTLISIARQFNTTTKALSTSNGLSNPDLIYAGQKLKVP